MLSRILAPTFFSLEGRSGLCVSGCTWQRMTLSLEEAMT